jgi:hypothetical protein
MRWLLFMLWACALSRASASPKGGSQIRFVDDEEAFISAVKSGSAIIVVRQHLDLWCARDYFGAGKQCDSTDYPRDLGIAASIRAIVVRHH